MSLFHNRFVLCNPFVLRGIHCLENLPWHRIRAHLRLLAKLRFLRRFPSIPQIPQKPNCKKHGKMISTEYIHAGEKGLQIIMHNTHSTCRSLKGTLKSAFGFQKRNNDCAGDIPSNAEKQPSPSTPSSSLETLPYQSLLKAHPQFHDLLDVSNWPTLPPPTNPLRNPKQPSNFRQRPEQLDLMIRPCLDSHDSALPQPYSRHHDGRGD